MQRCARPQLEISRTTEHVAAHVLEAHDLVVVRHVEPRRLDREAAVGHDLVHPGRAHAERLEHALFGDVVRGAELRIDDELAARRFERALLEHAAILVAPAVAVLTEARALGRLVGCAHALAPALWLRSDAARTAVLGEHRTRGRERPVSRERYPRLRAAGQTDVDAVRVARVVEHLERRAAVALGGARIGIAEQACVAGLARLAGARVRGLGVRRRRGRRGRRRSAAAFLRRATRLRPGAGAFTVAGICRAAARADRRPARPHREHRERDPPPHRRQA